MDLFVKDVLNKFKDSYVFGGFVYKTILLNKETNDVDIAINDTDFLDLEKSEYIKYLKENYNCIISSLGHPWDDFGPITSIVNHASLKCNTNFNDNLIEFEVDLQKKSFFERFVKNCSFSHQQIVMNYQNLESKNEIFNVNELKTLILNNKYYKQNCYHREKDLLFLKNWKCLGYVPTSKWEHYFNLLYNYIEENI